MTLAARLGRWFSSSLLAALVAAMLLVLSPLRVARADAGQPAGWELSTATHQVSVGRVTLHYDPALEDEALQLAAYIPSWWSEMEKALAGDLEDTLSISYVAHSGRIAEATGMPRWAAGVAHPESGEIVIAQHAPDGSLTDLDSLLRHEMAHVALYRATGGQPLPHWFHEGIAESFGNEIDLMRSQTLAGAVYGPGVPALGELEGNFRSIDPIAVTVSYAAARDFVNYMRGRDDDGSDLRQVMTELRRGTNFDAAWIKAYGRSLAELDGEWRTGLSGRFAWFPVISAGGLPLAALSPLMVIAAVRRRRQLREGWQRLAREDAAERAEFADLLRQPGLMLTARA
jgi:heme exporter protein D